jgi:hypothetical protein
MKAGGGSGIVEMNKSRRRVEKRRKRNVEYSIVGYKVVASFIIFKNVQKGRHIMKRCNLHK